MVQGNRTVKNIIRKRMDDTGETYTVAKAAVDAHPKAVDVTGKFESWEDLLPLLDEKGWVFRKYMEISLEDPLYVEGRMVDPEFLIFDAGTAGDAPSLMELGTQDIMLFRRNDFSTEFHSDRRGPLHTERISVKGKTKKQILLEVAGVANGLVSATRNNTPMLVRLQTIEEATLRNLIWTQENHADDPDYFIEGGKELVQGHLDRLLNNPQLTSCWGGEYYGRTTLPENLGIVTPYWEDVQEDMFNLLK